MVIAHDYCHPSGRTTITQITKAIGGAYRQPTMVGHGPRLLDLLPRTRHPSLPLMSGGLPKLRLEKMTANF